MKRKKGEKKENFWGMIFLEAVSSVMEAGCGVCTVVQKSSNLGQKIKGTSSFAPAANLFTCLRFF